jgi:hypothetical protein
MANMRKETDSLVVEVPGDQPLDYPSLWKPRHLSKASRTFDTLFALQVGKYWGQVLQSDKTPYKRTPWPALSDQNFLEQFII